MRILEISIKKGIHTMDVTIIGAVAVAFVICTACAASGDRSVSDDAAMRNGRTGVGYAVGHLSPPSPVITEGQKR